jgi:hypothetical protein
MVTAKTVTIYALCDPDTGLVRYVGKTIDLNARIRSHKYEAFSGKYKTRKAHWLKPIGGKPKIIILEVVEFEKWQEAEIRWIAFWRQSGANLTNYADGGQTSPVEGKGHSEETKAKLRANALKKGIKPPSRIGMQSWNKGSLGTMKPNRTTFKSGCIPYNKGLRRTHCRNGHEYTVENTRLVIRKDRGTETQQCRICEKTQRQEFLSRKLAAGG